MNQSICVEDYSIGPTTTIDCRNGLDFTLVFEECILSLLPTSAFILASFFRSSSLRKARQVVSETSFNDAKAIHLFLLVVLRFSLLMLWLLQSTVQTRYSIAVASVFLVESMAFAVLSRFEHIRAIRPSSLINIYLVFTIGLDSVRIRTLIIVNFDPKITALLAAVIVIKASLLFLEANSKAIYFSPPDTDRPPQETSGVLNRSVFWWLNSLFFQGYRGLLSMNDLFKLDEELSSEETFTKFERDWFAMSSVGNYRLARTVVVSLARLFLRPVLPNLVVMALTTTQPFLVTALLAFVSSKDSNELGYLIVLGYAVVYVTLAVFHAAYTHSLDRFVTLLRGCLVSIIYNQTLKLDLKEVGGGESLTLMSADVEHITQGFGLVHEASSNLVMTIISLGLLYRQLGLIFLAPLLFSVMLAFLTASQSGPYIKRQKSLLQATELRVGFISSIISSMRGVKVMGLVDKVHSTLRVLRVEEINRAKKERLYYALFTVLQTLSLSGTRWITYTVFGIIAILSRSQSGLAVTPLIASLAILNIFMSRLEIFLRQMPKIAASFGCLRRIEKFLLLETKKDNRIISSAESSAFDGLELQRPVISISDLSVGWEPEKVQLRDLNFELPPNSFTIVIGPVGSGKSTSLLAFLGETIIHKGFVNVVATGGVAYCAQTPWLVNKTIQENILGSSLFDSQWYGQVLKAVALVDDLKTLPVGDRTLVGSQGITLSGGQKQRIALARAVYSKSPVMLLDDIFSGLDPISEDAVFQGLFGTNGLLKNTSQTVVLATHAIHLLPTADMIILLGGDGEVAYQGPRARFPESLLSRRDLVGMMETEHAKSNPIATNTNALEQPDSMPVFHAPVMVADASAQDTARQTGDSTIWKFYLQTAGYRHILIFVLLGAICMGFTPAQTLWLDAWANDTDGGRIGYYLGVYSMFFVGEIALTSLWIWHVLIFPLSASSIKLHDIQLDALMSATMNFFGRTDTGKTTNRFSQDLDLIDNELPLAVIDAVEYIYNVMYKIIMIGIASIYLIPVFPFLLIAFWLIQRFYLRTSRQVRFLDLEAKAPLYTHFIETLAGLATIRAFGWEEGFRRQNLAVLQTSQRPFFILKTIQRWLTLVLDLAISVLAVIVAVVAVQLRASINPGLLGLALVNVMALGTAMQSLVSFWAMLETSIGGVSRIRSFSQETPSEEPTRMSEASVDWVSHGGIEFKDVTASYGLEPDAKAVVEDISLSIAPGEHVGICGRSGSGKSSLLSLLSRLVETRNGSISIDGVEINSISINQVRASLNVLSQEPFFLHGTVRDNLVITSTDSGSDDAQIQHVLTHVGLWSKISASGGLDVVLHPEESLSHGERQLFCLARALLHPSRIVILDEFTSNVDIDTDKAMQKIIRAEFKDKTIIAVAHRLDNILDFDRIIVLDRGRVVEEGSPKQLLEERGSAFRELYEAQG